MLIIYISALLGIIGTIFVASLMVIVYIGKISKLFLDMILNNFTFKYVSRYETQKNEQLSRSPKNIKEAYYSGICNEGLSFEAADEIREFINLAKQYKIIPMPCHKGYSLYCFNPNLKTNFIKALIQYCGNNIVTRDINSMDNRIISSTADVINSMPFLKRKRIIFFGEFDTVVNLDKINMNCEHEDNKFGGTMVKISTYSGFGKYRFIY